MISWQATAGEYSFTCGKWSCDVRQRRKKKTAQYLDRGAEPAVCKWSIINDPHEDGGAAARILCGLEIREDEHQNKDSFDLPSTQVYRSEIQYSNSKPLCHCVGFPLTHYFLYSFCVPAHTDCAILQGVGTVPSQDFLVLPHYSFSILGDAVLFFLPPVVFYYYYYYVWRKFALSSILLTKPNAARENQNARPRSACLWKFSFVYNNKKKSLSCFDSAFISFRFRSVCKDTVVSSKVSQATFSHQVESGWNSFDKIKYFYIKVLNCINQSKLP